MDWKPLAQREFVLLSAWVRLAGLTWRYMHSGDERPPDSRLTAEAQIAEFTGSRVLIRDGDDVFWVGADTEDERIWNRLEQIRQVVLGTLVPASFVRSGGLGESDLAIYAGFHERAPLPCWATGPFPDTTMNRLLNYVLAVNPGMDGRDRLWPRLAAGEVVTLVDQQVNWDRVQNVDRAGS